MENTKNDVGGTTGNPNTWNANTDTAGTLAQEATDTSAETMLSSGYQASSTSTPTNKRFSNRATQAKTMLKEKFGQAREQQGKWADETRIRVRENPMLAVGIAMAAGFMLRRLLSRSR